MWLLILGCYHWWIEPLRFGPFSCNTPCLKIQSFLRCTFLVWLALNHWQCNYWCLHVVMIVKHLFWKDVILIKVLLLSFDLTCPSSPPLIILLQLLVPVTAVTPILCALWMMNKGRPVSGANIRILPSFHARRQKCIVHSRVDTD